MRARSRWGNHRPRDHHRGPPRGAELRLDDADGGGAQLCPRPLRLGRHPRFRDGAGGGQSPRRRAASRARRLARRREDSHAARRDTRPAGCLRIQLRALPYEARSSETPAAEAATEAGRVDGRRVAQVGRPRERHPHQGFRRVVELPLARRRTTWRQADRQSRRPTWR